MIPLPVLQAAPRKAMVSSLVSQMLCCCQHVRDRDSKVAQKTLFKKITAKTDMHFSMKYLAGE